MSVPRTVAVCLLVVLVVAGCQAPTAEGDAATNASSASGGPSVAVANGSLSVDPGTTFARVQDLTGSEVPPPERIRAYRSAAAFGNSTDGLGGGGTPEFWRLAGLRTDPVNESDLEVSKNGYVTPTGEVVVYLGENATLADEQMVVAHELTHYVQTQNDRQLQIRDTVGLGTTESDLVLGAVVEGAAVYTTDGYMRQHGEGDVLNSEWYPRIQERYPDGHVGRLLNARYIFGAAYMSQRLSSPAGVSEVYENPPRTTEQVIHGYGPDEEPQTSLSVNATAGREWQPAGTDQFGELFVRYALESSVGPDRAAAAADGWGNDTLVYYQSTERRATGYVWVLNWDDAGENTEFRRALTDALDERGDRAGGAWSLDDNATVNVVNVDAETTALVLGPESFVRTVTVATDDGTVGVDVSESTAEFEDGT